MFLCFYVCLLLLSHGEIKYILQLDCESSIHRSSVHRIVKKKLQLKCLKKINAQELTAHNKQARMTRAQQLLNQYPNLTVNFMFLLTKSCSPLLHRPAHRTIVFTSVRVPERRTSTKTDSFDEIDIQQVSRWTLDRWMLDSQSNCNKVQCYVTILNICV